MSSHPDDVHVTVWLTGYLHESVLRQCRLHGNDTVENMIRHYTLDGVIEQEDYDTLFEARGLRGFLARVLDGIAECFREWSKKICPNEPQEDLSSKS